MSLPSTLRDDLERTRRNRELIEGLISDPSKVGPLFAPICRLDDDSLVGHKATAAGQVGTDLSDTLALAEGAQAVGLIERLDWAFRCHTFDVALAAGLATHELHLTVEPETYGSICPPRLIVSHSRGKRELTIVDEIPLNAFDDLPKLHRTLEEFRDWGWRTVVVDVADDPAALAAVPAMRPSAIQIDLDLPGRDAQAPSAAVRRLLTIAHDCGAEIMALGVDTARRRDQARELGATTGRGLLYGAPKRHTAS